MLAKLSAFEYENTEKVKKVTTILKDQIDHPLKKYVTEILT